jgi:hypothetical protein
VLRDFELANIVALVQKSARPMIDKNLSRLSVASQPYGQV